LYHVAGDYGLQTYFNSSNSNVDYIWTLEAIKDEISSEDAIECFFSLFIFLRYKKPRF
jgi:hypothetical protein